MHIYNEDGFNIIKFRIEQSDSNFNYIISCNMTNECVVIDPIDPILLLDYIRKNELSVQYVINTHAHPDHISGNNPIIKVFLSSKILIHPDGLDFVAPRATSINDGDNINVGKVAIKVIHTPGHCREHITLLAGKNAFVGDTLFVSGCGNTKFRGNVDDLYDSISSKISTLDNDTKVFCGHDYAENNLKFAKTVDKTNESIDKLLSKIENKEFDYSTIEDEKIYNPFLRLDNEVIINTLQSEHGLRKTDEKSVFTKLRELRNNW